jgi:tetratricopeptide (TPR) repeat protein
VQLRQTYLSADPPCLEYEYVAGGDLADLLYRHKRSEGGLAPQLAAQIVLKLARTMGQAHRLKPPIVHRDLKPANVLVESRGEGKVGFRIADFGIGGVAASRAIEQTRRSTGPMLLSTLQGSHTPLYASPQQQAGEAPDPRDDVHALGVIWYQLLIGDLAKGAPTGKGWRNSLLQQGVSTAALDLMEECFEGDAAHRITDAGVLAARLEALLKPHVVGQTGTAGESTTGGTNKDKQTQGGQGEQGGGQEVKAGEGEEVKDKKDPGPLTTDTDPLAEGRACLERKEYRPAVKALNQVIRATPTAEAYRLRARAYLGRGNPEKALADLDQVIRLEPRVGTNLAERGHAHATLGNHDRAINDFTQAVQLSDRSAGTYLARGRSYAAKGWLDQAFADFDTALRVEPGSAEAYFERGEARLRQGAIDQALADFGEAVRLRPDDARFLNARGRVYLRQGKVEEALAEFNAANHADPSSAEGYLNRATVWASKGQHEQAVADLNHAVSADPGSADAFAARARARAKLGQHGWAVSDYTKAIKRRPRDAALYLDRGRSRAERGDFAEAIQDFQASIKLDPGCTAAYHGRGVAYLYSGKFGKAIADFTRALELDPTSGKSVVCRAWAYLDKGQYDQATVDADAAIRIEQSALAYWIRGSAHLGKKALDLAVADFTEALGIDPQHAGSLNDRGRAHHLAGAYDQAVADFTAAIKLDGKNPDYYRNRARSYEKQGERAKARADRDKAATLAPTTETEGTEGATEGEPAEPVRRGDARVSLGDILAGGLLRAPLGLFRQYKGQRLEATLQPDGRVLFQGQVYDTCSTAAEYARGTVTGRRMNTNGWTFWQYVGDSGQPQTLDSARQRFSKSRPAPFAQPPASGPPDSPVHSDPATPSGEVSVEPQGGDVAVIRAFLDVRSGASIDFVLADPETNVRFIGRCRELGATTDEAALNWALIDARKRSRLPDDIGETRKYSVPAERRDQFEFASEIAARFVERQHGGASLDRIICTPALREDFDRAAGLLAPGFTPLEYR